MTSPSVGIDGYRRGWVAARRDDTGIHWVTAPVEDVADLLPLDAVVGIDMPIGLADDGWRECDALAKTALRAAASRVFMTPPRAVLELGLHTPNDQVQQLSRELTGQGVSRQAMALSERILVLDAVLRTRPPGTVIEVHPELSFAELAGRVLAPKKSAVGVAERWAALRRWLPDVDRVLAAAPPDVPVDDALDALAALWTAARWSDRQARTLPAGATRPPFIAV